MACELGWQEKSADLSVTASARPWKRLLACKMVTVSLFGHILCGCCLTSTSTGMYKTTLVDVVNVLAKAKMPVGENLTVSLWDSYWSCSTLTKKIAMNERASPSSLPQVSGSFENSTVLFSHQFT